MGIKINEEEARVQVPSALSLIDEFMDYIKRNNHVVKEFNEIILELGGPEKARQFVSFCLSKNFCSQRGIDAYEIRLD